MSASVSWIGGNRPCDWVIMQPENHTAVLFYCGQINKGGPTKAVPADFGSVGRGLSNIEERTVQLLDVYFRLRHVTIAIRRKDISGAW